MSCRYGFIMIDHIIHYWMSGGVLMLPLLILSLTVWVWVISLHGYLSRRHFNPLDVKRALQDEGVVLTRPWSGRFMQMIGLIRERTATESDVQHFFEVIRMATLPSVRREIRILKALVSAAPLLGLLGTVIGMMATFDSLSEVGAHSMTAMSSGVSQALVTTQVGLVIAVIGLFSVQSIQRMAGRVEHAISKTEVMMRYAVREGGVL